VEFAATMRSKYGVSAYDIGDSITYGEAYDLTVQALEDTNTTLAAVYNGWAYPSSLIDLLSLASSVGDKKAFEKASPWGMQAQLKAREERAVTSAEIEQAQAELEQEIIIR
jgi:hypothetical protein